MSYSLRPFRAFLSKHQGISALFFGLGLLTFFNPITAFADVDSQDKATERIVLKTNCVLWRFTERGLKRAVRQAYKGEEFLVRSQGAATIGVFGDKNQKFWFSKQCKVALLDFKQPSAGKMKAINKVPKNKRMNCPPRWLTLDVTPKDGPKKLRITLQQGRILKSEGKYCLSPNTQRVMLEMDGYTLCLFALPKSTMQLHAKLELEGSTNQMNYCITKGKKAPPKRR